MTNLRKSLFLLTALGAASCTKAPAPPPTVPATPTQAERDKASRDFFKFDFQPAPPVEYKPEGADK
jgi:hypothetical protein